MTFRLLCRPYHTLLFLVEEKDIHYVPLCCAGLPHAAVPGGGRISMMFLSLSRP